MRLKRPHLPLIPHHLSLVARRLSLLLTSMVLAFACAAHSTDTLRVDDVVLPPGQSVVLNIALRNATTSLTGWQCDIVLPAGLSLALKDSVHPAATLGERFATTGHIISSSQLGEGAFRFVAISMQGESIPGDSGTLFAVTLQAADSVAEAQGQEAWPATGRVTNIEFTTQDNQQLPLSDVSFTIALADSCTEKCATPTIAFDHGDLLFECETDGVAFVSEVKVADARSSEEERVSLAATYEINVYATRAGLCDSDVATATIGWRNGKPVMEGFSIVAMEADETFCDVNGDGAVDVADIAVIISEMARRARRHNGEWE